MMKQIRYILLAVGVLLFAMDAEAQMNRRSIKKNNKRISNFRGRKSHFSKEKAYSMVGISLNAMNYYGDLAPNPGRLSTDLSFTRPSIGLIWAHRFGPRYSITTQFMYGGIKGADSESADKSDTENALFRYRRNLSFRNRIKELSVTANIDLFENMATYISRVKFTPYAYLGVAVFHHNPQAQAPATDLNGNPLAEAGEWVDLRPLGTEGQNADLAETDVNFGIKQYGLVQISIPMGLGVRLRLNEVMDFSFEVGYRYLFTDYIDDVSQNYIDLGHFGSNELAKAMSYRSNELSDVANLAIPAVSAVDGQVYNLVPGYGTEFPDNFRGSKKDKDVLMVTSFKLTYIIGKTFHRAKFR